MNKNKAVILGASIAIVVVVLVIGVVTNISRHNKHDDGDDNNAAVLSSTTKPVATICSLTEHKKTCVESLSSLANNQTATPKDFLQKAIQIASEEVGSVLNRSDSSVGGKAKDDFNKMAYDDCKDLLNYAVDELQASFSQVGDARLHTINDRKEELNNWLSAVISYQQSCMDGITQPDLKDGMSNELLNATKLTDNALAILTAMSEILSEFNISIPDASQPKEAGGTATSRRLLNARPQDGDDDNGQGRRLLSDSPPDDDYYNGQGFVATKRLLSDRPPDDDYYNGQGFVATKRLLSDRPPDDDYYNGQGFVATKRLLSDHPPDDDYYNGQGFVATKRLLSDRPPDDDYYNGQGFVATKRLLSERPPEDDYYNGQGFVATRRLLNQDQDGYPKWLGGTDRHLLAAAKARAPMPTPNAVVAKDGSGQYKTITQALAAYPKKPLIGSSRYVIYVKAGVYEEYVTVTKNQPNVLIYGDGPRKTRVTGKKSFAGGVPTFQTATFIAIGNNFMAMSMGMANTAGPEGHQAVALRVQSDMAVIYNCRMDGNQDTLYAQTHRQFYRNCVISGTIDFIFGDSSVVIQNSLIIVRKPMDNQQNTVMAQGRTNRNEKTGIVIQNCRIVPDVNLQPLRFKLPTYLGRPWKQYSRAVIMESTLADFIHPDGWMPWAGNFALDTLYFAEYANRGPGANTAKRVKWKGFHVLTNRRDALQFTTAPFIQGDQWLKPAGIPYSLGLIH